MTDCADTMGCGPSNTAKIADNIQAAGNGILPHNDEVSSADRHKYRELKISIIFSLSLLFWQANKINKEF
jgi:hypothetical protein